MQRISAKDNVLKVFFGCRPKVKPLPKSLDYNTVSLKPYCYNADTGSCISVTRFNKAIVQAHDVPLVLIVDNASIHRNKQMAAWLKLLAEEYSTSLYFLPAYSPELNRIEMFWKQMKYHWRDFKVMTADQIETWVGQVPRVLGLKYMFTF